MRKKVLIALVVVLALAATGSLVWAATPPSDVEFEVSTTFGDPSFGPFIAMGPAVDAGIVCDSGDTIDLIEKYSGFSPRGFNLQVVKLFTCDDGSGEFLVKMQVRIDWKGDNFNWNILGGTGAYDKLHGTGKGIGVPIPGGVHDVYTGAVHID